MCVYAYTNTLIHIVHRSKLDLARGLEAAINEMVSETPTQGHTSSTNLKDKDRLTQDIKCRPQKADAGYIFTIFE